MLTQATRIIERQDCQDRQDIEESNAINSGDADNKQVRTVQEAAGFVQLKGRHFANSLVVVISDKSSDESFDPFASDDDDHYENDNNNDEDRLYDGDNQ